jgi:hypothetical protein
VSKPSSTLRPEPYAWKLGHDVRPTRYSLGVTGCFECHAAGAPIFEGRVTAVAAVPEDQPLVHSMWELAGYDKQMLDAWNQSFQGRVCSSMPVSQRWASSG